MDSYEKCIGKLEDHTKEAIRSASSLKRLISSFQYRFAYPEIDKFLKLSGTDKSIPLKTLRAVIGTLDPSLPDVTPANGLKDTFIIRRGNTEIVIQEGKLLTRPSSASAAYITADAAKQATLSHADVAEGDTHRMEIDFDYEHGMAVYEINASTGEVVRYEMDYDD